MLLYGTRKIELKANILNFISCNLLKWGKKLNHKLNILRVHSFFSKIDKVINGLRAANSLTPIEARDFLGNSMINFNNRDFRNKLAQEAIHTLIKLMTTEDLLKHRSLRLLFIDCAFSADFLTSISKQGQTSNLLFHFRTCYFPCSVEQFRTEAFENTADFTSYRKEAPVIKVLDTVKEEASKKSK